MSDLGNKKIFAKNLNYYMEINKKSRIEVCRDLEIPYSTYTDWCNGNIYPRIDKIEILANYFEIKKSDLVENKENIDYFEFTVEDDSMYPILDTGDIAIIQKQTNIENNKYYLILLDNQKTIRKITLDNNKYILKGVNNCCKEIIMPKNEFSKIKILGKIIKAQNESIFK